MTGSLPDGNAAWFARRASGVLLPVFSLPGSGGIGTLGQNARKFVDFLADAGQRWWQLLPLVPTGGGNSPYMSPSSFAGNPLLLDLEDLAQEGLLTPSELEHARFPGSPDRVDYPWLYRTRPPLLRRAWERGRERFKGEMTDFCTQESSWLPDFTLFQALQDHFGGASLRDWPSDVRKRRPDVLEPLHRELEDACDFHTFLQFLFFRQWGALKAYANQNGVYILGDLPFYVSPDSAEVWSQPQLFQLNRDLSPSAVSGVPPDSFSDKGQHWGTPLYDWTHHRNTDFAWWRARAGHMARLYDAVRIDHFRAFHTCWSIPAGAADARTGHWEPGPGTQLLDALRAIPGLNLIAEDLGELNADARDFMARSHLPGMRLLLCAFDGAPDNPNLPHNCPQNAVVYTGTHDNSTFVQWLFSEASPEARQYASDYLLLTKSEGWGWGGVRGAWASPCRLAIAPMQDLLGLGSEGRMNTPGTLGEHNWSWRVRAEALNSTVADHLRRLTQLYGRR